MLTGAYSGNYEVISYVGLHDLLRTQLKSFIFIKITLVF